MQALKYLLAAALAALLLACLGLTATGLSDTFTNGDVIVVPGNAVTPQGQPSPRLRARLDVALNLYRQQRAPLIFVSGGTGKEGVDEATAMAAYLMTNGVPPAAIVKDSAGINTFATAKNCAAFLRNRGLKSAIVATQFFHVARTRLALERNGVVVTGAVHARYFELRDGYSLVREVLGYAAYFALR